MASPPEIAADSRPGRSWTRVLVYLGLVALTVGGFLVVRYFGAELTAAAPTLATGHFGAVDSTVKVDVLMHLLLALAVIIVTARVLGAVFAWARQPAVIGEVLAGIFLGPSLLGRISPGAASFLLPAS